MNRKMRDQLRQAILDLTLRYRDKGYFSDASVRVFSSGETLFSLSAGNASENSWFDVASLTKVATATQILFLIRDGRLQLDTLLAQELAEIQSDPFLSEQMGGITLRRLLTHTSGLPDWYPFYTAQGKDFFSVLKMAIEKEGMTTGMVYSDLNFMLLGMLLERVRGKPLQACLQEDLVQPYQLGGMTYLPDPSLDLIPASYGNPIERHMCAEKNLSFDRFRPDGVAVRGEVNDGNTWYYFGGVSGHAGLFAQTEAYARLCRLYMRTTEPLLLEAQREQPDAPTRGFGFQTGISYPHGCGHTGFTGTGIYFSRELDIGVVSFTNRLFVRKPCEGQIWEYRRVLHEIIAAAAHLN